MKKDRNCGGSMPYPVYPPYQTEMMNGTMPGMMTGGMPGMMPGITPGMMPINSQMSPFMNSGISSNTIEQQLNTLEQQINLLDKRITNLENMYNNSNSGSYSNQYNSSNYQMM